MEFIISIFILSVMFLLRLIFFAIGILISILIVLFVLKFVGWIFGIPLLLHIFTTLRNVKL
jgi:hypothetical protein